MFLYLKIKKIEVENLNKVLITKRKENNQTNNNYKIMANIYKKIFNLNNNILKDIMLKISN